MNHNHNTLFTGQHDGPTILGWAGDALAVIYTPVCLPQILLAPQPGLEGPSPSPQTTWMPKGLQSSEDLEELRPDVMGAFMVNKYSKKMNLAILHPKL